MGRPASINEADITKAVDELLETGKPVNPYRVRQVLGRGSTTKIAHFLQGLDIETTYEDSEFQTVIDLNDERSHYLAKLVRPLIFQLEENQQAAIDEAKAKFEAQRQELEDLVNNLEEKLAGKQSELDTLETRLENAESQRDSQEEENLQLKIEAAANYEKQIALHEKIHAQSEEITERKKQLEQADSEQAALKRRYDLQLSQMRGDFDELKEETLSYRSRAEKQFAEDRAEKAQLQQQIDQQRNAADRADGERQRLEKELYESQSNVAKLQESLAQQYSHVEALDKRLNDSESTKKRVEESHKELKNALTDMQQSNLTLETANRSLAKEVEFLKEILRKFEAVREVATSEDPIPTSSENKPGGSER